MINWGSKLFVILLLIISFGSGYLLNEYIKPEVPDVGPITIRAIYADDEELACYDMKSFESLLDLILEMGKEFKQ